MAKKLFISQPMRGKSDEEIITIRLQVIEAVKQYTGEDIEVIDSFFQNAPVEARPLWFLGKSLELLSTADIAVFVDDWDFYRGCKIENICCQSYDIEYLLYKDGVILKDKK